MPSLAEMISDQVCYSTIPVLENIRHHRYSNPDLDFEKIFGFVSYMVIPPKNQSVAFNLLLESTTARLQRFRKWTSLDRHPGLYRQTRGLPLDKLSKLNYQV